MSFKKALTAWGISGQLDKATIAHMAKFDLVNTDYRVSNVAAIKQLHTDIIVLGYRDLFLMPTNLPDWKEVNSHEEWFYHNTDGTRFVEYNVNGYGYDNYLMNIGEIGWRNYFASYMKQAIINAEMNGLFIDDVWNGFPDSTKGEKLYNWIVPNWEIVNPTTTFHAVCKAFITYVKQQLGSLLVICNTPNNTDYMTVCDGKIAENFLTMFKPSTIDINALQTLSGQEKYYLTFGRNDNQQSMLYCLAGFLLGINGANTYFGHTNLWGSTNGYYPEMETAQRIGTPINAYYSSQNILMRDFTGGIVLFNPSETDYTITLNESYQTLDGVAIKAVNLPSQSGYIALKTVLPAKSEISIYTVRDLTTNILYRVLPNGEKALCTIGENCRNDFTFKNIGQTTGTFNIKILNISNGLVLFNQNATLTAQQLYSGNLVFTMPTSKIDLRFEVTP